MRRLGRLTCAALAAAGWFGGGGADRTAFAVEGVLQNPGNGHWYAFVTVTPFRTWSDCKSAAEAQGGYLATITSAEEQQWVAQNTPSAGQLNWWLGGTDSASEGVWTWITGETWSYTNWSNGEPNNCCGGEHWLQMTPGGAWNDDLVYATEGGYIAEWDTDPNAPPVVLPPTAPINLAAVYSASSGVTLTWTDTSSDETGFRVERRPAGYSFSTLATTAANTASHLDLLLYPSTPYTYRVRAFNSGGDSAPSNEVSITTDAGQPVPVPPKAPSQLVVDAIDAADFDLAWTDNSADETLFALERAEGGAPFGVRVSAPADTTAFEDGAIRPGWPYTYRVRALSLQGPSPYSNTAGAELPATLAVTPGAGSLVDSSKLRKDKLKATAALPEDAALDVVANGLALQAGPANAPFAFSIAPADPTWRNRKGKLTWKTAKGALPKVSVTLDTKRHVLTLSAKGFDFAALPSINMRFLVASGAAGGGGTATWVERRPGSLRSE